MIQSCWPKLRMVVNNAVRKNAAGALESAVAKLRNTIDVKLSLDFDIGPIPPVIVSVFAESRSLDNDDHAHVDVCCALEYLGKDSIKVEINVAGHVLGIPVNLDFSVDDVQVRALVSVVLGPIIEEAPVFGGLRVSLLGMPSVKMSFAGLGAFGEILGPAMRFACKEAVDMVLQNLVLPGGQYMQLARLPAHVHSAFAEPMPLGYLRVDVHRACGLPSGMIRSTNCEIEIEVGAEKFRTSSVRGTNAIWIPAHGGFVPVHSVHQLIHVRAYDDDNYGDNDSLLGAVRLLTIDDFVSLCGAEPTWFVLDSPRHTSSKHQQPDARPMQVLLSAEYLDVVPGTATSAPMPKSISQAKPSPQGGLRGLPYDYVALRRLVTIMLIGVQCHDDDVPLATGAQVFITVSHGDPPRGWRPIKQNEFQQPTFAKYICSSLGHLCFQQHNESVPLPQRFRSTASVPWASLGDQPMSDVFRTDILHVSPPLQRLVAKLYNTNGMSISELAVLSELTETQVQNIIDLDREPQLMFRWSCAAPIEYPSATFTMELKSECGEALGSLSFKLSEIERWPQKTMRMKLTDSHREIWLCFTIEVNGFKRKELSLPGRTRFINPFPWLSESVQVTPPAHHEEEPTRD